MSTSFDNVFRPTRSQTPDRPHRSRAATAATLGCPVEEAPLSFRTSRLRVRTRHRSGNPADLDRRHEAAAPGHRIVIRGARGFIASGDTVVTLNSAYQSALRHRCRYR